MRRLSVKARVEIFSDDATVRHGDKFGDVPDLW